MVEGVLKTTVMTLVLVFLARKYLIVAAFPLKPIQTVC